MLSSAQTAFAHAQATTTVQFDREIVRILNNRCVMCHMENGPAFPFVTYEQTYAARWKIRQSVLNRHMPPWPAVPGYGDFANDNALTQREIDFLVSWAESYGPRNNGAVYTGVALQTPSRPVQARTDFDRWALGKPDVSLPVAEATRTIIDLKLESDRWLRGLEYRPGNRSDVHAVSFSIQETGQWIGSWTPWHGYVSLADGLAIRVPARAHIVAEMHYRGDAKSPAGKSNAGGKSNAEGKPSVGNGTLGLYFAAGRSPRPVSNLVLGSKPTKLTVDTNVLALQPTLRPGLEAIEVSARIPNAAPRVLLFARDIQQDWPTPYVYRKPVLLPQGTELVVKEHYAQTAGQTPTGTAAEAAARIDAGQVTLSIYEGPPIETRRTDTAPGARQPAPREHATPNSAPASTQRFKLKGQIRSVDAENRRVVVAHEAIPGLMGAMTMSYSVSSRENLQDIAAGDEIRSDVVVSDTGSHLENIEITRRKR